MILNIIILSALVSCVSLTPVCDNTNFINNTDSSIFNNADPSMQLYNSVKVNDYKAAIKYTFILEEKQRSDIISSVVNKLLSENRSNVVEFAYRLWVSLGESIVKIYFPIEFRLMFNEDPVLIVNKRDELALKLEVATDYAGDRASFGDSNDKTSHRVSWKLIPIWERNKIYFKIWNKHRNQYLKLEVKADDAGDHKAFGSDEDDTYRHEWYFKPVVHEKNLLFYIYNRNYKQPLKLARYVDDAGDRQLWGHNGEVNNNAEQFGWHILPF